MQMEYLEGNKKKEMDLDVRTIFNRGYLWPMITALP